MSGRTPKVMHLKNVLLVAGFVLLMLLVVVVTRDIESESGPAATGTAQQ